MSGPIWLTSICNRREYFEGSAVSFLTDDGEELVYAFMFARKDDYHSEWCRLIDKDFYSDDWGACYF